MEQIAFYLKKFNNLGLRDSVVKKAVIDSVKEIVGLELEEGEIDLNGDQVRINKTGPEKSEIFINKSKIEERISSELNQVSKKLI